LTKEDLARFLKTARESDNPQLSGASPDELTSTLEIVLQKMQRHMASRGHEMTLAECRALIHECRLDLMPELVVSDAIAWFEKDDEPLDQEFKDFLRFKFDELGRDGFLAWLKKMHEESEDEE
jgi:hypothetical protein